MPRSCSICANPERAEIDRRLVEGQSYRSISADTGTSSSALRRHTNHLAAEIAQAQATQQAQQGQTARALAQQQVQQQADQQDYAINVGRDLYILHSIHKEELQRARKQGNQIAMSRWSYHIRRNLELAAKIQGQMPEAEFNILVSPQFIEVQEIILTVLGPYPELRRQISGRLLALEQGDVEARDAERE
jgi:hypothetical protein